MVIAIIAVLAAFIAPRVTTLRQSEARLAVDQIADLMRMWAYRNSVMSQQVGIWHNPESDLIGLMIRDIDPMHPDDGPVWQEDKLSMPVRMPDSAKVIDVIIDNETQNLGDWFVQSSADGSRPRLEIAIETLNGVTRLLVQPYSNSVVRSDGLAGGAIRRPVDLDAEGQERVAW